MSLFQPFLLHRLPGARPLLDRITPFAGASLSGRPPHRVPPRPLLDHQDLRYSCSRGSWGSCVPAESPMGLMGDTRQEPGDHLDQSLGLSTIPQVAFSFTPWACSDPELEGMRPGLGFKQPVVWCGLKNPCPLSFGGDPELRITVELPEPLPHCCTPRVPAPGLPVGVGVTLQ